MSESLWRAVFNTNHLGLRNNIEQLMPIIRKSGYPMFTWNGNVYRVPKKEEAVPLSEPLGISVGDFG